MDYVFLVAAKSKRPGAFTGKALFGGLVEGKQKWVIRRKTQCRERLRVGDRVLFYLAGEQLFLGTSVLASGAVVLSGETTLTGCCLRDAYCIKLAKVHSFAPPIPRHDMVGKISWVPIQGGCNYIASKDFDAIVLHQKKISGGSNDQ